MNAQSQKLTLAGGAGAVEALRDDPVGGAPASGVAVIAHPHPLFGGTMDNKVVQTLARAFTQCGWTAVRFNFRGVGASAGVHDGGVGEADDVTCSAIAQLWPARAMEKIVLVGTAASRFDVKPLPPDAHDRALVIHGEQDDTVALASVMDWARPQSLPVTVVPGGGHFFHGQLPLLKNLVVRPLRS